MPTFYGDTKEESIVNIDSAEQEKASLSQLALNGLGAVSC